MNASGENFLPKNLKPTSNDPYAQEDLDTVEKAMLAFHNYVNTVVDGEMKLLIQGSSLEGQEYRDAIISNDGDRHSAHEKAIGDAKLVNRLAAEKGCRLFSPVTKPKGIRLLISVWSWTGTYSRIAG